MKKIEQKCEKIKKQMKKKEKKNWNLKNENN